MKKIVFLILLVVIITFIVLYKVLLNYNLILGGANKNLEVSSNFKDNNFETSDTSKKIVESAGTASETNLYATKNENDDNFIEEQAENNVKYGEGSAINNYDLGDPYLVTLSYDGTPHTITITDDIVQTIKYANLTSERYAELNNYSREHIFDSDYEENYFNILNAECTESSPQSYTDCGQYYYAFCGEATVNNSRYAKFGLAMLTITRTNSSLVLNPPIVGLLRGETVTVNVTREPATYNGSLSVDYLETPTNLYNVRIVNGDKVEITSNVPTGNSFSNFEKLIEIDGSQTINFNATVAGLKIVDLSQGLYVNGYDGVYDGQYHGIDVGFETGYSGYVIKYGESASQCTLDSSPTYKDINESEGGKTVYFSVYAVDRQSGDLLNSIYTGSAKVIIRGLPEMTNNMVTVNGYVGYYDGQYHGITINKLVDGLTVSYRTTPTGDYNLTEANAPKYKDVLGNEEPRTVYYKISKEGYADKIGEANVLIRRNTSALTLSPSSGSVAKGGSTTSAISNGSENMTINVEPTGKATATINGDTLTIVAGQTTGTATITITRPAGNYTAETATYTLTITNLQEITNNMVTVNGYVGYYDGQYHGIAINKFVDGLTVSFRTTATGDYNLTEANAPKYKDVLGNEEERIVYYKISKNGYEDRIGEAGVLIKRKDADLIINPSRGTAVLGETKTVSITNEGGNLTASVVPENMATATIIDGNRLSITAGQTPGTATITVSREEGNYTAKTATYELTISNLPNITSDMITIENYEGDYDGQEHGIIINKKVERINSFIWNS